MKVEELESNPSAKRGRGSKRKAASQCNTVSTLCSGASKLFSRKLACHCISLVLCIQEL